jgi:hypothetical protein
VTSETQQLRPRCPRIEERELAAATKGDGLPR